MKQFEDTESAHGVSNIRSASHNVLFTVANSNAMNGFGPGAEMSYTPAAWEIIRWVATALLGLLWVVGLIWVIRRVRRHGSGSEAAA